MIKIQIYKLYKENTFGDMAGVDATFHAFDEKERHIVSKQIHGKFGTAFGSESYLFTLTAATNVNEVRVDVPEGAVCEWIVIKS